MYHVSFVVFWFWSLTPKKDIVCSSVLVLQCWCVPFDPPPWLHPSLTLPQATVPVAKKETKSSWGGAAEKIKSGEGRGCSHFTVTLAFLRSKAFFPVFFGTRYDTDPPPILFVFPCSFLLICFGTSAREDWSFPLWPAGSCIPVQQEECELENSRCFHSF